MKKQERLLVAGKHEYLLMRLRKNKVLRLFIHFYRFSIKVNFMKGESTLVEKYPNMINLITFFLIALLLNWFIIFKQIHFCSFNKVSVILPLSVKESIDSLNNTVNCFLCIRYQCFFCLSRSYHFTGN